MRVNIYAEEMTDRVELVTKQTAEGSFTGIRFYLELPVTMSDGEQVAGPFEHHAGDDDSAAVTFWGKHALRAALLKALELLPDDGATARDPADDGADESTRQDAHQADEPSAAVPEAKPHIMQPANEDQPDAQLLARPSPTL